MKKPDFAVYLDYQGLTAALRDLVDERRELAEMYSIGKTYEGRDIWAVEITNRQKGSPSTKTAMYIDGNHHAGEVTGSAVCLYTVWYLLSNYGVDPFVTRLVDDVTWYIVPRISADGAEVFLHTPQQLRSSVRQWPPRDNDDGLNAEDIDGDGWILQMRVKDESGDWRVSDKDPRLMIRREPWDEKGPFYKIYQEGFIKNYDGVEVKMAQPKWGLDINRNYPANWEPGVVQRGAGPYPLSEPETRAVADFIISHPNIAGAMSYHTTMGAILRPSCTKLDKDLPALDVVLYKAIGAKGKKITGYPDVSTFEDYVADKTRPLKGVFMDWLYEHQGIITFSTELWDASVRAGNPLFPREERSAEDSQLALLVWNDRELAGEGFAPWRKFDHPQLGEVELGGWKSKFVLTNPPPRFLEGECHKNCLFTLYHASCLPRLRVDKVVASKLAEDVYLIKAHLVNDGFMPTNGCQQALDAGKAKPIIVEIGAEAAKKDGFEIVTGKARTEKGQLAGLSGSGRGAMGRYNVSQGGERTVLEWTVKAKAGAVITVSVSSTKAGCDSAQVVLE